MTKPDESDEVKELKQEILSLHQQLAESKLDALQGWDRWKTSNRMCLQLQQELEKLNHQNNFNRKL